MRIKLLILIALTTMPVMAKGYWETYKQAYEYCAKITSSGSMAIAGTTVCADTYMRYNYHPETIVTKSHAGSKK